MNWDKIEVQLYINPKRGRGGLREPPPVDNRPPFLAGLRYRVLLWWLLISKRFQSTEQLSFQISLHKFEKFTEQCNAELYWAILSFTEEWMLSMLRNDAEWCRATLSDAERRWATSSNAEWCWGMLKMHNKDLRSNRSGEENRLLELPWPMAGS